MRATTAAAALLTLAACAAEKDHAQQYRDALPSGAAVQIGVPRSEGSASALTGALHAEAPSAALADAPGYGSEYARTSYWMATTVNLGVWWTLELVRIITAYPPTRCDDASCTWGPWLGDGGLNYYRLQVEKVSGAYDWTLSGQSAAAGVQPWQELIVGHAVPGRDRDHGSGDLEVFYDHFDGLQHATPDWKQDWGTLTVGYDNTAGAYVEAQVVGAHDDDPDPARNDHLVNAAYRFDATGTDGDLQLAFRDVTAGDQVTLHTRWKRVDGAGRGDAHYVGAGGTPVYDASECWNGANATLPWAEVYDTKTAWGAEANCVFAPAAYATIAVP